MTKGRDRVSLIERELNGIRLRIGPKDSLDRALSGRILDVIRKKSDAALMFPTGSTPEGVYAGLVSQYRRREGGVPEPSWRQVKCFNMDEYWRLPPWSPDSYAWFIRTRLYMWVDIHDQNVFYPDALAPTEEEACAALEAQIRACGGLDHTFLGIGVDGHIAFNEAGLPRGRTHVIELAASTVEVNSRYFKEPSQMPTRALSAGIDTLLESREISLMAVGETKAQAIHDTLLGPVAENCPASFLREVADRVTTYLDEAAASRLPGGAG